MIAPGGSGASASASRSTDPTDAAMSSGGGGAADVPSFFDFYLAFNGRPPFPWQERLARHVARAGEWPQEIGVPTGLGKTACLEIAVWWLQAQADLEPGQRTAPTRIWWVVNRRLPVDSTWEHARRLQSALDDPPGAGSTGRGAETLSRVAERLRRLSAVPARPPLDVIRLRGGVDARSPQDPSRPDGPALHAADVRVAAALPGLPLRVGHCGRSTPRWPGPTASSCSTKPHLAPAPWRG